MEYVECRNPDIQDACSKTATFFSGSVRRRGLAGNLIDPSRVAALRARGRGVFGRYPAAHGREGQIMLFRIL
jgi:hypothetical protein